MAGESLGRRGARNARRRAALIIGGLVALAIVSFALGRPHYPRGSGPVDFRAFYCAGAAVAARHDPYLTEPLRSCENVLRGFPPGRGLAFAIPAPLPGYALAPFALLSLLPYPVATALWSALLLASFGLTVLLLARLCPHRIETIFAALSLATALDVYVGQPVPIVCAAVVATAFLASRGRDRSAALAASLAMFEPNIGLPVCLALAIARPGSRAALATCGAVLAALAVGLVGMGTNVEYLRDVLPAQALSEISHEGQYSLTYLAHLAGFGEHAAIALGTFSYVVMLGIGIAAGRLAAARTGEIALAILVPVALTAFGGPYIHVQQLAVAIPAGLVLGGASARAARPCALAVLLLAVPWSATYFMVLCLPLVIGAAFVLAHDLLELTPPYAALASAAVAALLLAFLGAWTAPAPPQIAIPDPREGVAFAEAGWRTYVEANFHANVVPYAFAKLLAWCGLILIAVASFARERRPEARPRAERPARGAG